MTAHPHSSSLLFIAGEASGDAHAAEVIKHIKSRFPEIRCFGAGGPRMREAGMELVLDLTQHAVLGLVEVLRNYFKFRRFFYQMLELVEQTNPDAVVLVDYPGFNLRFAKALHRRYRQKRDRPQVIYYICPQVWAWGERRVKVIERCVDLMLSIFPFEKAWFAARAPGLRVEFVGHPMLDRFPPRNRAASPQADDGRMLALLPGSRLREVRVHWPILREAARYILQRQNQKVVALAISERVQSLLREDGAGSIEISDNPGESLGRASAAIACSGTATLECAYFGVPAVVLYKVAWPTYWIGRMLVKVKHLAMPNVLAGETIYPEFIQGRAKPEPIARETIRLLTDPGRRAEMKMKLARVIESLGEPGASARAAQHILDMVTARQSLLGNSRKTPDDNPH
jgi:lipid-A-disaccharide synthase